MGRTRALPVAQADGVEIEAAGNEYEAFQLVLRPTQPISNVVVLVSDLVPQNPSLSLRLSATNVTVTWVDYVPVVQSSDPYTFPGLYPDPLVPLSEPLHLTPGTHQPFWITVYVPPHQPAGDYLGTLLVQGEPSFELQVPLRVRVFGFTLPSVTHTPTAYYADVHINGAPWHRLQTLEQQRQVWDLHLENFRRHRVSPYSPHLYAPIRWSFVDGRPRLDFRDFDTAMKRYLDEFGFATFNLFGHKSPPFPYTLEGHSAFGPEYQVRLEALMDGIMQHLREMGWAKRAYCYWVDEPAEALYPWLLQGMAALQQAAPDLRRLLTWNRQPPAQYVPLLHGTVDIWVPMLPIAPQALFLERPAWGDELWCYVAVQPTSPRPNLFIDQPAMAHRMRLWVYEKYGFQGDLYYAVNQWPGRNPWEQTQTWDWSRANGDGTLVYPPTRTLPDQPVFAPPVDSIRWELNRDALEDREYLWLLRRLLEEAELRLGPTHEWVLQGRAAIDQCLAMVTNVTVYAQDPQVLLAARRALAGAIEPLYATRPFFTREPESRAVDLNEELTLWCEALAHPPPRYQWFKDGHPIAGATGSALQLPAMGPSAEGIYHVVASNLHGRSTSRLARVLGRWVRHPRVLGDPQSLVRTQSYWAVLTVTALGAEPKSYLWFKDGEALGSGWSPRPLLLLTNLSPLDGGLYHVVVSNEYGTATSAVARLTVMSPWELEPLVPFGSRWQYRTEPVKDERWREPGSMTNDWEEGSAPFGQGALPCRTPLASRSLLPVDVAYFRGMFELGEEQWEAPLLGQLKAGPGAVVYLNGVEIRRINMPEGPLRWDTPALSPLEDTAPPATVAFEIPAGNLRAGPNSLAVELHAFRNSASPTAFWTLDEAEPPWRDLVGGHDFVPMGTGWVSAGGRIGACVSNAASASTWLETASTPALQIDGPFTVGGWFAYGWSTGDDPPGVALEKEGEFRLYYTGTRTNRYRFAVGAVEVQDETPGTLPGQWRFVVAWFDGTQACIQVDQGPVYCTTAELPSPTSNPLRALRRNRSEGGFAMDEVFLYRRVLSASERAELFTLGVRNRILSPSTNLWFDLRLSRLVRQRPFFPEVSVRTLMRKEGESAGFRLTACSAFAPIQYQWLRDGHLLPGATNEVLFLPFVGIEDAGRYHLVASNAAGAATSAPIHLVVVRAPVLSVVKDPDQGGWSLQLPPVPVPCTLWMSTNLLEWVPVTTWPASPEASFWPLPVSPDGSAAFYRLELSW